MGKNDLILEKTHDFSRTKEPVLAVIFIHGIASDSSSFNKALNYLENAKLAEKMRFITFDLLGSGDSYESDDLEYDYKDQLTALNNAIKRLNLNIPIVLVGHSMGTLIVTRYANTYKKTIKELILVSPPLYTEKDLINPAFATATKIFREAVSVKDKKILEKKSFNNSMEKIVLDKKNFKVICGLKTPAVLVYGKLDQFISSYNIPIVLKENPKYITVIETDGRHGVSRDKYVVIGKILEDILNRPL